MSNRSWRDVAREQTEKRQRSAQERAAALSLSPSNPTTAELPYIEGEPRPVTPHVEVKAHADVLQAFEFTPRMAPNTHHLVVRLNTRMVWQLIKVVVEHMSANRPGPVELVWTGVLEEITDDGMDNADEHPDTVKRVEEN